MPKVEVEDNKAYVEVRLYTTHYVQYGHCCQCVVAYISCHKMFENEKFQSENGWPLSEM